jgi:NTE family protein
MIGSSIGAICVGLLAVGYNAKELESIVKNLNFEEFTDDTFGYIRDLYRLFKQYGICKGDTIKNWYGDMIANKTNNRDITFAQVFARFDIDLTITGTCLDRKCTDYFNKTTNPDMPIVDAVRISMSIPGFFCSVKYNNCTYVDGGILNNYPIWYYPDIENTIGLKLVDKTIEREDAQIYHDVVQIKNIRDYTVSLVDSMMR